jgi:hypothetical protein
MTDKAGCTHAELVPRVQVLEADLKAFEKLMDERDKRYQEGAVAQKEAVNAALATSKEAVVKAENATEKRFEGVNEFRESLADQASTFMRSDVVTLALSAMDKKIDDQGRVIQLMQTLAIQATEKRSALSTGLGQAWGFIAAGAAVLLVAYDILHKP